MRSRHFGMMYQERCGRFVCFFGKLSCIIDCCNKVDYTEVNTVVLLLEPAIIKFFKLQAQAKNVQQYQLLTQRSKKLAKHLFSISQLIDFQIDYIFLTFVCLCEF